MEAFKAVEGIFYRHFDYSDLRELLAIKDEEYKMIIEFKRRVIQPSLNEINLHTDLNAHVEYGKNGRKISSIAFAVEIREEIKAAPVAVPKTKAASSVIADLIALGFLEETAQKYKNRYGVKRIQRNIDYMAAKQKETGIKIKDTAAYLNQAIKEDLGAAFLLAQQAQAKEREKIDAICAAREKAAELAHMRWLAEASGRPLKDLMPPDWKEEA